MAGDSQSCEGGSRWSGRTRPCWSEGVEIPRYEPLEHSISADVCVVGAGIAGLTTAYLLLKDGKRVVVLDQGGVGSGETGRTSAHLASILDDRFMHMRRVHGDDRTRVMYESHRAAIERIESISQDEAIECEFERLPAYLFLGDGQNEELLAKELESARAVGVAGAERVAGVGGVRVGPAIRFVRQGRFQPLKYLGGLARVVTRLGGVIYCGTRVTEMRGGSRVKVKTQSGHTVFASAGVAATNVPSPLSWQGIYTKESPYRTYVIGLELGDASIEDALYWDFEDPYHYVRRHGNVLLVGGEDHKTGQNEGVEPRERLGRLERWARARFPGVGAQVWEWSGQVSEPDDGAAFIGRVPGKEHEGCYVIAGDSGMGLTHGTLGAMLVSDLIAGRENAWEEAYAPSRKPTGAVLRFIEENLNAAAQYRDYIAPSAAESEIPVDGGAVVRHGISLEATYRGPDGVVHRCSAVCPHLKGVVRWNDLEKTWDCPCHGSRFSAEGKVIMGPAVSDLEAGSDAAGPLKE